MIRFLHVFGHRAAMKHHLSRLIVGRETSVRMSNATVHVSGAVEIHYVVVRDTVDLVRLHGYRFDLVTVDESFDRMVTDRIREEFGHLVSYLTK